MLKGIKRLGVFGKGKEPKKVEQKEAEPGGAAQATEHRRSSDRSSWLSSPGVSSVGNEQSQPGENAAMESWAQPGGTWHAEDGAADAPYDACTTDSGSYAAVAPREPGIMYDSNAGALEPGTAPDMPSGDVYAKAQRGGAPAPAATHVYERARGAPAYSVVHKGARGTGGTRML